MRKSILTDPRFGSAAVLTWATLCATAFCLLGGTNDNPYIIYGFGPSDRLMYVGFPINTWTRWASLIIVCILDTFISIWACDVVYPWTTFNVFDSKRKDIEYSYWTTMMIVQAMNAYQNIRPIFTTYLNFTQIDILVARSLSDITISWFTTHVYLRPKRFCIVVEDADEGIINGEQ